MAQKNTGNKRSAGSVRSSNPDPDVVTLSPPLLGAQDDDADATAETPAERPWEDGPCPDGVIIGPGDEMSAEGVIEGDNIKLTRDIYRVLMPTGSKRWTFYLLKAKGTTIPKNRVPNIIEAD